MYRPLSTTLLALALAPTLLARKPVTDSASIRLSRELEGILNRFVRSPEGTAHALLSQLPRLRAVIAIPEDNTGVGLWLRGASGPPPAIRFLSPLSSRATPAGVEWELTAEVDAPRLEVAALLLGSVRTLRDYHHTQEVPRARPLQEARRHLEGHASFSALTRRLEAWSLPARLGDHGLTLDRPTLDGRARLWARLSPGPGTSLREEGDTRVLSGERTSRFTLVLGHDLPRLRPLPPAELLSPAARARLDRAAPEVRGDIERELEELSLLAYRDRYLAGSWRFLTYFGRDTMLSLRMLAPVLSQEALAAGLRSVLDRLSPEGQVAHEENLGDQASLDRLREFVEHAPPSPGSLLALRRQLPTLGAPFHDRVMVDDDLMLVGLAREVLSRLEPSARATFLADREGHALSHRDLLLRNLEYLLERLEGSWIGLRDGHSVGDWRDSQSGLAFQPFPFSVNGALAESAARSLGELLSGELLGARPELVEAAAALGLARLGALLRGDVAGQVARLRERWRERRARYRVTLSAPEVQRRLIAYLDSLGGEAAEALRTAPLVGAGSLGDFLAGGAAPFQGEEFSFHGLVLTDAEEPLPVMHSDAVLLLLDVPPWELPEEELEELLRPFLLPYPLGLALPAGFVVASPGLSGLEEEWRRFDRHAYHGSVVWGWQLAMLDAVLLRWDRDPRLTGRSRELWDETRARLEAMEPAIRGIRHEELWTWAVRGGAVLPLPFGIEAASSTESNALQLWNLAPLANALQRLGER
jgi:hypothetical protein